MGEALVELCRRAGCAGVAAALLCSTGTAAAQEQPVGTTAGAATPSAPVGTPPGTAPGDEPVGTTAGAATQAPATADTGIEEPEPTFEPGPSGLLVAGGVTLYPSGGSIGYRLDVGPTLSSGARSELRLLAVITLSTDEAANTEIYTLAPFVTLQYVRNVLPRRSGRFALVLEAGVGPGFAFVYFPDAAFQPERWENEVRGAGRIAGAVEYRASRGFFAAVQPVGVFVQLVDGDPEAKFEFAARVGYQWQ